MFFLYLVVSPVGKVKDVSKTQFWIQCATCWALYALNKKIFLLPIEPEDENTGEGLKHLSLDDAAGMRVGKKDSSFDWKKLCFFGSLVFFQNPN